MGNIQKFKKQMEMKTQQHRKDIDKTKEDLRSAASDSSKALETALEKAQEVADKMKDKVYLWKSNKNEMQEAMDKLLEQKGNLRHRLKQKGIEVKALQEKVEATEKTLVLFAAQHQEEMEKMYKKRNKGIKSLFRPAGW